MTSFFVETENYSIVESENADKHGKQLQSFTSKEDGHSVSIERPDKNTYNVMATDKDGKESLPTTDELRIVMQAMKSEGHETFELGTIKRAGTGRSAPPWRKRGRKNDHAAYCRFGAGRGKSSPLVSGPFLPL